MKKNVSKSDEDLIKNYDENSNKGYILEIDVEYLKNLLNLHSDLPLLLVCNINYKENYVVHIRTLKQALNHGQVL